MWIPQEDDAKIDSWSTVGNHYDHSHQRALIYFNDPHDNPDDDDHHPRIIPKCCFLWNTKVCVYMCGAKAFKSQRPKKTHPLRWWRHWWKAPFLWFFHRSLLPSQKSFANWNASFLGSGAVMTCQRSFVEAIESFRIGWISLTKVVVLLFSLPLRVPWHTLTDRPPLVAWR